MYAERQNRKKVSRRIESGGKLQQMIKLKSHRLNPYYNGGNVRSAYIRSVVQRLIGFEFQSVGSQNVSPNKHGYLIKDKDTYKIMGDMGDLEYVMKPVEVNKINDAKRVASEMADAHQAICAVLKPEKIKKIFGEDVIIEKGYSIKYNKARITMTSKTNAHPQATLGIEMKDVIPFFNKFSELKLQKKYKNKLQYSSSNDGKQLYIGGNKSDFKYNKSHMAAFLETVNSLKGSSADLKNDYEKNFVIFVLELVNSAKVQLKYPEYSYNAKNALFIMPRTSLRELWLKIPESHRPKVKEYLQDKMPKIDYENDVCKSYKKNSSIKSKLINKCHPILFQANTKEDYCDILYYEDWISSLDDQDEMQSDTYSGISEIYTRTDGKANRFNIDSKNPLSLQLDENDKEKKVDGILIELRALERNVPPDKWTNVVENVLNLIITVQEMSIQK